ncbi:MAG: hypothetical protein JW854_00010 [Actinobacteria bacterium]|nr:hypothetical protein [Actinomycetota bacterium]
MILAPYERLTVHTYLSAEEALQRLESVVGPEPVDPDLERIAAIEEDWRKLINAEPYSSPESQLQSRPRSYRFPVPPRRDSIQPQVQEPPYWGEIEGYHFKIHRIVRLRIRGWRPPALEGDIQPEVNGCSICATVQSDPVVMVGWAGIVIIFALSLAYGGVSLVCSVVEAIWFGGRAAYPSLSRLLSYFFQGLAACLGYSAVVWGGFKSESIKSKAFLRTLFQADRMDEFGTVDLIK